MQTPYRNSSENSSRRDSGINFFLGLPPGQDRGTLSACTTPRQLVRAPLLCSLSLSLHNL